MVDKNYLRIFEYTINPATITVPMITPNPISHSCENNSKFVIITIPIKFAIIITNTIIILSQSDIIGTKPLFKSVIMSVIIARSAFHA